MIGMKPNKRDVSMKKTSKMLIFSALSNVFLSLIKIIFGILGKSKALVADGVHSISDLSTDFVAIVGNHFSNKPADENHPYGHGKLDYITSVIIGTCIIILGALLARNSISSNFSIPSKFTIIVVVITIIIKSIVSTTLIRTGKKENNSILISSGKESFGDVFSSALVLILIILSQFSKQSEILSYCDMIGSFVISGIIIIVGIRILIDNFSSLIGQVDLSNDKLKKVYIILDKIDYDMDIDKVYLLKYGTYYKLTITIFLDENTTIKESSIIRKNIEDKMLKSSINIKYITINILPRKK